MNKQDLTSRIISAIIIIESKEGGNIEMNKTQYNNLFNEGGEGYIPSTKQEMAQIEIELAALKAKRAMTQEQKDAENNARQDAYLAKEKATDWN